MDAVEWSFVEYLLIIYNTQCIFSKKGNNESVKKGITFINNERTMLCQQHYSFPQVVEGKSEVS